MGGLANGFVNLFKNWGRGIGNAADNFLLGADARKAISDEVINKFKPMIERARLYENKRAANIKDLDKKLNDSKKALADDQNKWQQNYDSALAGAKAQRQKDIADYDTKLQGYQDALDRANSNKQSIKDQLYKQETTFNRNSTIFTDVKTGKNYIFDPYSGEYKNLSAYSRNLDKKGRQALTMRLQNPEYRLFDKDSGKVINVFNANDVYNYDKYSHFNNYLDSVRAPQDIALRDADSQITKASNDLTTWKSNPNKPTAWDDTTDLKQFKADFKKSNAKPSEYSFNGQTYTKESELDKAYKDALAHERSRQDIASRTASGYITRRDKEIAKRIQDAKDIKKAKLALGAGVGAGALAAGAAAMYGGDDTDTGDTSDNIDNTANTYTGEPDPDFNVEKEGQAILKDRQQVDTGFDPDKADAEAILAGAAYDKGVEDGSSVRSSGDLGNIIGASTRGHTMDDRLYELIKAMKDPYKADAIANYIYSRHGDDTEVQNLGWRGWLNKYYGDSLRSILGIDPSGYKGMHVSGGL